jgi:hypothetical protein
LFIPPCSCPPGGGRVAQGNDSVHLLSVLVSALVLVHAHDASGVESSSSS